MADLSPPRRRVIEDRTVRNLSPPTQRFPQRVIEADEALGDLAACPCPIADKHMPATSDVVGLGRVHRHRLRRCLTPLLSGDLRHVVVVASEVRLGNTSQAANAPAAM